MFASLQVTNSTGSAQDEALEGVATVAREEPVSVHCVPLPACHVPSPQLSAVDTTSLYPGNSGSLAVDALSGR